MLEMPFLIQILSAILEDLVPSENFKHQFPSKNQLQAGFSEKTIQSDPKISAENILYEVIKNPKIIDKGLLNLYPRLMQADKTSAAIFPNKTVEAVIIAREDGVLSGNSIVSAAFKILDPNLQVENYANNGEKIKVNQQIAKISGNLYPILMGERTVLNFLCHLSGISSRTRHFVDKIKHTKAKILDTRKTIPGFRNLAKEAVIHGGAINHRFGLFDAVLVKNNHIDAFERLTSQAEKNFSHKLISEFSSTDVTRQNIPKTRFNQINQNHELKPTIGNLLEIIRQKWGNQYPIFVEARSLYEVKEIFKKIGETRKGKNQSQFQTNPSSNFDKKPRIERILLDNMDIAEIKNCVEFVQGRVPLEATGNVNLQNVAEIAEVGVDFISIGGSLTMSAPRLDFSLRIKY